MPNIHNPVDYLSTAKLNTVLRRVNARSHGGPQDPTLAALTLKQLVARWKRSTTQADRRLLRLIERIAEIEIEVWQDGGDTQKELQKPEHGRFSAALMELTTHSLRAPHVPAHDPGVIREQLDSLWNYAKHHAPLPQVPRTHNTDQRRREMNKQVITWVQAWWGNYQPLRENFPCLCQYRHEAPTYKDLFNEKDARYKTPENLLHRTLAHLHGESPSTIKRLLANYQQLERRM